ncbi:hypothetical protein C8R45DRAFT_948482 [Mycena sanguinolenta]|nr:hypothetical protein C8R45DRAFT_948482 [Mycena sanguinolenta]
MAVSAHSPHLRCSLAQFLSADVLSYLDIENISHGKWAAILVSLWFIWLGMIAAFRVDKLNWQHLVTISGVSLRNGTEAKSLVTVEGKTEVLSARYFRDGEIEFELVSRTEGSEAEANKFKSKEFIHCCTMTQELLMQWMLTICDRRLGDSGEEHGEKGCKCREVHVDENLKAGGWGFC